MLGLLPSQSDSQWACRNSSPLLPQISDYDRMVLKGGENMDEIEVLVNDLYEMIKQLKEDGMDTVTISILPADDNDGDRIPPSLWFEA